MLDLKNNLDPGEKELSLDHVFNSVASLNEKLLNYTLSVLVEDRVKIKKEPESYLKEAIYEVGLISLLLDKLLKSEIDTKRTKDIIIESLKKE